MNQRPPMKAGFKIGFMIFVVMCVAGGYLYFQDTIQGALGGSEEVAVNFEQPSSPKTPSMPQTPIQTNSMPSTNGDNFLDVAIVTWYGTGGGILFNNGFLPNMQSRFFTEYGIQVRFHVMDDFEASRKAFANGDIDVLWVTVDAYPTETYGLKTVGAKLFITNDTSRGGDIVMATYDIQTLADAKGETVALALGTPSHSMWLCSVEADDSVDFDDFTVSPVYDALKAGQLFKQEQVKLATVWSPDNLDCKNAVVGSHELITTDQMTHIIFDGFYARESDMNARPNVYQAFYNGFMIGNAEINSNPEAKKKASLLMGAKFNNTPEEAMEMMETVRFNTHGDNVNLFGLNSSFSGVTLDDIYTKMSKMYSKHVDPPLTDYNTPTWNQVMTTRFVQGANLTGTMHNPEGMLLASKPVGEISTAKALTNKAVQINFASGSAMLDQRAKIIIQKEFLTTVQHFKGSPIRIGGFTDNTGDEYMNQVLSEKRGNSVKNYLVGFGLNPDNIYVVGYGEDPNYFVASNSTPEGRAKNRRVGISILE